MRLAQKARVLAEKYNNKYNGSGRITYEDVEFKDNKDLHAQKLHFANWVKVIQKTLDPIRRRVIFITHSYEDPHYDHAISLIVTPYYCFISDSRAMNPSIISELRSVGLEVVPILNRMYNRTTGKMSFIQAAGSSGCLALAGNVAKHIANQNDASLELGVCGIGDAPDREGNNRIIQATSSCRYKFDFQATDPSGDLLRNILKYSQNHRFENDYLDFYKIPKEFLKERFDPSLRIRSDERKGKGKWVTNIDRYLAKPKNILRDPSDPSKTRGALVEKERRLGEISELTR